jgi:hypothetical protein
MDDVFEIPEVLDPPSRNGTDGKARRGRKKEKFIRPMPLAWVERAAHLPGKALALGLCLWYKAGLTGDLTVLLCLPRAGLGLNEQAARRALHQLKNAGLVWVERQPGRGLRVTLLDVPEENDP